MLWTSYLISEICKWLIYKLTYDIFWNLNINVNLTLNIEITKRDDLFKIQYQYRNYDWAFGLSTVIMKKLR